MCCGAINKFSNCFGLWLCKFKSFCDLRPNFSVPKITFSGKIVFNGQIFHKSKFFLLKIIGLSYRYYNVFLAANTGVSYSYPTVTVCCVCVSRRCALSTQRCRRPSSTTSPVTSSTDPVCTTNTCAEVRQ